ncbi:MAG TPA: 6,7-dimethyl-8-ribityllumazine synthase [Gemmatimonadales bacterium]|nr:6,7-dimethyl-8-ribityllumazine synthase [Gemmatimonadales bacterium]
MAARTRKRAVRRVAVLVSRYNEIVTRRLLEGARAALVAEGVAEAHIDVHWVPGAFELPAAAAVAAGTGRYLAIVALGCVIRGETPHFEYVAGEAARGLGEVARISRIAVGFGVLTTEDQAQALARAGGDAGNKGAEAAHAALESARVLEALRRGTA